MSAAHIAGIAALLGLKSGGCVARSLRQYSSHPAQVSTDSL